MQTLNGKQGTLRTYLKNNLIEPLEVYGSLFPKRTTSSKTVNDDN